MTRLLTLALVLLGAGSLPLSAQMATAERLEGAGWWPTKRSARQDHVGPDTCATCHPRQASTQPATSMARTGDRATDSRILREHDALIFRSGTRAYSITQRQGQHVYSVTDGAQTRSAPLAWAFGAGKVGQSFLFERDGKIHEARVSYYDTVRALDFTPNRAVTAPRDLDDAMSRPVDEAETRRCFACHTTASTTAAGRVDFAGLIPGVTCEACHGPGREHVTAIRAGRLSEGRAAIVNPKRLSATDAIDFCGSCHATFWDVKLANERGVAALRSQPHRLQSSRCWSEGGDERLTCVACHDPHQPLVRDAAIYDGKCLSCHVGAGATPSTSHPGGACKVGTAKCSSCHMPKYEVPDMHFQFTDHLIRVVR